MNKAFTKGLFFLLVPLLVITAAASAQTITVGAIDPGPYGRGSSITLPFHIDNTTGCISQTNTFRLVLSDASGVFSPATSTVLATKTGFYETFLNGTIPLNAVAGNGYRLRIESTSAGISLSSNAFTINAVTGVLAGVSSQAINPSNPDVFGTCAYNPLSPPAPYEFTSSSTAGSVVTAKFINEKTQAVTVPQPITTAFAADPTNYTVIVKAENGGIVGTKSYELINNFANNGFFISGTGKVCLGGGTPLTYNVDITSVNGIQNNYPGLTYKITWGDNSSNEYTLCDILALNAKVSHVYTSTSCGSNPNSQKNVFQVDIKPTSKYCGPVTQTVTTYASVIAPQQTNFSLPPGACVGSETIFQNQSTPGDDPNSSATNCTNINARYTWYVDGNKIIEHQPITQSFRYIFTTNGIHHIKLHFENTSGLCDNGDLEREICVQNPPQPNFTMLPTIRCLADGPLTPVITSTPDETCTPNSYNWKQVAGPVGGVTFNAALKTPSFIFHAVGIYKFQLDITTISCGTVSSTIQTVVVNDTPQANLSGTAQLCGKGLTLSFDPTAPSTSTQTTFSGTAETQPNTYTWTVNSADGGTFAFAPGSNANSQYPRITFNDYATYNISVTHTNNCGTITRNQQLTFVEAPPVSAGPPQAVCEDAQVFLTGSPGVGGLVTAVRWTSPTASAAAFGSPNSPNTTYNPTAADIANGQVLLTYTATTSLAAPCNQIPSTVLITIIKKATVTSAGLREVCSGTNFNYTITAANPATTFTWTAALTSGTATGFGPTGSGNTINDLITNNGTTDAVVTYTIIPTLNGCQGTPFNLRLTVHPLPVFTPPSVIPPICSGEPANITLTSNINPTTYTWTVVATNGITGATNQPVASTVASIQDILVNNSGTQGTVTYNITPYNGSCPGPSKPVTIKVNPAPVKADAGPDLPVVICAATYPLQGNDPSPGTGEWSPVSGITFSNKNNPHAIASGLLPGQTYQFTWTITAAVPGCPPSFDVVTVIRSPAAVGGTTATITPTVCAGTNVVVTLTGQVGTIVWQQSINGGANWVNIPGQTTSTLTYPNLLQTTQFRAVVTSGACAPDNSTITTITVVPPPPTANAGTYAPICDNNPQLTLIGNNPGAYVGEWKQVPAPTANVIIEEPNNFQTKVTGLTPGNTYQFQWTIYAKTPCTINSPSIATVVTGADVTPNFTSLTQVCGSQVTFTNTSTPDLPGNTYLWDFGDGFTSTEKNPTHPFTPNADGSDVKRTVSLTITNSCTPHLPKTTDITISPATPIAEIYTTTTEACGSLSLTVENRSKGNNKYYEFYLEDEHGVQKGYVKMFDKTPAVFPTINIPNNARWKVYMQATNNCDVKGEPSLENPIDVAPSSVTPKMTIKDNQKTVCLGSPVTFINLTTDATIFSYIFYDEGKNFLFERPAGTADYSYTFLTPGKYYVSIKAGNSGCGASTELVMHDIEVIPLPQPDFLPSVDADNNVTFVNNTPDAGNTPRQSLIYEWNFGDGSPVDHIFTPAKHFYSYENSPYTVTLTATIPGSGCKNIKVRTIEIKFTGELFLPNAFQPASSKAELRTFKAKGQKLKEWHMQIFNNWGQLIWQTTQLNSNGEPVDAWDGTFKGAPVQQGVYIWQITARFLNGFEWKGMSYNGSLPKRTGVIHLIR